METDLAAPTKIGSTTSLGTHTIEVRLDKWRAYAGPDVPEGVARAPHTRGRAGAGKSPNWNRRWPSRRELVQIGRQADISACELGCV
jgi:hypothetical protein